LIPLGTSKKIFQFGVLRGGALTSGLESLSHINSNKFDAGDDPRSERVGY
jgi:hypothetical protein